LLRWKLGLPLTTKISQIWPSHGGKVRAILALLDGIEVASQWVFLYRRSPMSKYQPPSRPASAPIARLFLACTLSSLTACSSGTSATDAGPMGGSPDASSEPAADAAVVLRDRGFIIFSNRVEPCSELGCPADRNLDLYRLDFDLEKGTFAETRLTDNSDGFPPDYKDATTPDDDIFVGLSPDGAQVYFANGSMGTSWEVYRIPSMGGEPVRVSPEGVDVRCDLQKRVVCAYVSPDGADLYYVSAEDGDRDIYAVDAMDGGNLRNLSSNDIDESVKAFLPDGSGAIVQTGTRRMDPDGLDLDAELYLVRFADSALIPYTDNQTFDLPMFLSDDGSLLIFERRDDEEAPFGESDGPSNLWAVKTDGSEPAYRLTSFADGSLSSTGYGGISPDGSRVFFEFSEDRTQIYSAELDNQGNPVATQLTMPPSGTSSVFRTFIPGAQEFIYTTNDRPDGFGDIEIYKRSYDGQSETLLTDFDNEEAHLPRAVLVERQQLLYTSPMEGGDEDLFIVSLDGSARTNVTDNDVDDRAVAVSPTESWLLYDNSSEDLVPGSEFNDSDLYARSFDGGEPIQLISNRVNDYLHAIKWDSTTAERIVDQEPTRRMPGLFEP
jgi:Tol biopolymer transport system component